MSIIGPCSQAGRLRAGALKHSLTSRQNQNCQTQTLFYTTKTLRVIRIMAQLEWLKRSSPTWEFWAALYSTLSIHPTLPSLEDVFGDASGLFHSLRARLNAGLVRQLRRHPTLLLATAKEHASRPDQLQNVSLLVGLLSLCNGSRAKMKHTIRRMANDEKRAMMQLHQS